MNSSNFANQDLLNVEWTYGARWWTCNLDSYGNKPHRGYALIGKTDTK